MSVRSCSLVLMTTAAVVAAGLAVAQESPQIPERPEHLEFGPLDFEVPDAGGLRHELPGGVVVYVVPDRSLPLVDIVLNVRTGAYREPEAQPGLAALTATMMRVGGTASRTPEQFDEEADFLAARVGADSSDTGSSASLNVLTSALDEGLDLLFDMLREPRFDAARLAVEKGKIIEAMKQRNDDAGDIQAREWSWLLYGREHYASRSATAAEVEAIGRDDLERFHRRTWGPDGLVIAVSGDVEPAAIVAELGRRLVGWSAEEKSPWPPAPPEFTPTPGLYHVEKEIPQAKVRVGHHSLQVDDWSNPDLYALSVMNDILGGGGFTSRIMRRVRTEEGLAYGAGSSFGLGTFWTSTFNAGFASKNPTAAFALEIVLEEIARIRESEPSAEEMKVSKASFIDTFPRAFESAAQIAGTFARDEILGRPHSYWREYRERLQAVTPADVTRVAKRYLKPEELVMLVVGQWDEVAPGDPDGEATMEQFNGGRVEHLPLRDPLSLEPVGD